MKLFLLSFALFGLTTLQAGQSQQTTLAQQHEVQKSDTEIPENIVASGSIKSIETFRSYQAFPSQPVNPRTPSPDRNTPSPETEKLIATIKKEFRHLRNTQEKFDTIKKIENN